MQLGQGSRCRKAPWHCHIAILDRSTTSPLYGHPGSWLEARRSDYVVPFQIERWLLPWSFTICPVELCCHPAWPVFNISFMSLSSTPFRGWHTRPIGLRQYTRWNLTPKDSECSLYFALLAAPCKSGSRDCTVLLDISICTVPLGLALLVE